MKATFNIPDDLYRKVKARSALEGRPVKDVVIDLFRDWLGLEGSEEEEPVTSWNTFQPPLAHLVPKAVKDHSIESMRESIVKNLGKDV